MFSIYFPPILQLLYQNLTHNTRIPSTDPQLSPNLTTARANTLFLSEPSNASVYYIPIWNMNFLSQ